MPDAFSITGANSTVSIAATTTSANVQLGSTPRSGPFQVRIENSGPSEVCFKFGTDKFDVGGTISKIDTAVTGKVTAAHFDDDLGAP